MIEQQVPELADGGYWYVLPAITDSRGNLTPPHGIKSEWVGVYGQVGGTWYVLIRALSTFTNADIVSDITADDVIASAAAQGYLPAGFTTKPGMRVRDK